MTEPRTSYIMTRLKAILNLLSIAVRQSLKKLSPDYQGSIAQLGERLPYKQRVTGSIPVASTIDTRNKGKRLHRVFFCLYACFIIKAGFFYSARLAFDFLSRVYCALFLVRVRTF